MHPLIHGITTDVESAPSGQAAALPPAKLGGIVVSHHRSGSPLFRLYEAEREEGETPGYFNRRYGAAALIRYLKAHPRTADLLINSGKLLAIGV